MLLRSRSTEVFGKQTERAMKSGAKFVRCAHCGNAFPVVDGRAQQWRVSDNRFACNEFCAEGVEEQDKGRSQR
jgi:hypothetical protein